jgi:purine-binding chemotaxis protein CheW
MRTIVTLMCRVARHHCALPLTHVVETSAPLPVRSVPNMPAFISGLSLVRGMPVPVVNAAALIGVSNGWAPARFITLQVADRQVILAVDEVIGIRAVPADPFDAMPALLGEAPNDVVVAIGALDASFLWLLDAARIVPETVWRAAELAEVSA